MECNITQATSATVAAFSALTAVFSAATAFRSYRLAKSIQEDTKSDERLVIGKVSHPDLRTQAHWIAVIQIPVFNKSKRKAYIDGLTVYDRKNAPIEIAWSDEINELGMPQHPSELVGLVDSATIYVRANFQKEFEYARVLISHSFSETKQVIIFDPSLEFVRAAEQNAR